MILRKNQPEAYKILLLYFVSDKIHSCIEDQINLVLVTMLHWVFIIINLYLEEEFRVC